MKLALNDLFYKICLIFSRLHELPDTNVEDNLNDLLRIFPCLLALLLSTSCTCPRLGPRRWEVGLLSKPQGPSTHRVPAIITDLHLTCVPKVILST